MRVAKCSTVTVKAGSGASKKYGPEAKSPLDKDTAELLLKPEIGKDTPTNALVTYGRIVLTAHEALTTFTIRAQGHTAAFKSSSTWNRRPGVAGTVYESTVTVPARGRVEIDVTPWLQQAIASGVNYGLRITTTSTAKKIVRGQGASSGAPVMEWDYSLIPAAPTGLAPSGGAVSIAKPTLTWLSEGTAWQVQIDETGDGVADWTSAWIASRALDLATTAYAGIALGASISWQVRAQGAGGNGPWSPWMPLSRVAKGTVTITSPAAVVADGSPPVTATFSGTVESWYAEIRTALGITLASSGVQQGAPIEWTPPTGLSAPGSGSVLVAVRDDVDRVATTGDPIEAIAESAFSFEPTGAVAPVRDLHITTRLGEPWQRLRAERPEGIPDLVRLWRDDVIVAEHEGVEVFTGTRMELIDWTAPMGVSAAWVVECLVNGESSVGNLMARNRPSCVGVWIGEPITGESVALWGDDQQEMSGGDIMVTHQTLTAGTSGRARTIHRRVARVPRSGRLSLDVIDASVGPSADEVLAVLERWANADVGTRYRLVLGHLNLSVGLSVDDPVPTPLSGPERIATVGIDWWEE